MNALRLLRFGAVLVATLTPFAAEAGTRFDFTTEVTGYSYGGRMTIDGTRSRLDVTQGAHPLFNPGFSIITRRAGREILVLDHAQHTYFVRRTEGIGGHLATARGLGKASASKARVRRSRDADGRHVIRATYDLTMVVEGETLAATVDLTATFDVDRRIEQRALPWGLQFAAKTGFENVDRMLALRIPTRLPLRQHVTISRRIADGPLITETILTTASNVRSEEVRDEEFLAPEGYRYQEPVFAFGQ